ncbi:hypothetical protein WN51_11488 [Melipona quadrifasciata]|uniref:Uncharacterized protein n=1 Tax=Melipona quadrifasciata TaxID=166423 RepID=A0A0M9A9C4_9HYME|nr:hypothetical protein WN51_11488 [Melipona quadrifasciata]
MIVAYDPFKREISKIRNKCQRFKAYGLEHVFLYDFKFLMIPTSNISNVFTISKKGKQGTTKSVRIRCGTLFAINSEYIFNAAIRLEAFRNKQRRNAVKFGGSSRPRVMKNPTGELCAHPSKDPKKDRGRFTTHYIPGDLYVISAILIESMLFCKVILTLEHLADQVKRSILNTSDEKIHPETIKSEIRTEYQIPPYSTAPCGVPVETKYNPAAKASNESFSRPILSRHQEIRVMKFCSPKESIELALKLNLVASSFVPWRRGKSYSVAMNAKRGEINFTRAFNGVATTRKEKRKYASTGSPPPARRDWPSGSTNRSFQQNLRIVKKATRAIDVDPPQARPHVAFNAKGLQLEREKQDRIARENFILLKKLRDIMQRKRPGEKSYRLKWDETRCIRTR